MTGLFCHFLFVLLCCFFIPSFHSWGSDGPTFKFSKTEYNDKLELYNHDLPSLLYDLDTLLGQKMMEEVEYIRFDEFHGEDYVSDAIQDSFGNWYIVGQIRSLRPEGLRKDLFCEDTEDTYCDRHRYATYSNPNEGILVLPPLFYLDPSLVFAQQNNPSVRINDQIKKIVSPPEFVDVFCQQTDFGSPFRALQKSDTSIEMGYFPPLCDFVVSGKDFEMQVVSNLNSETYVLSRLAFFDAETYGWHGIRLDVDEKNGFPRSEDLTFERSILLEDRVWGVRNFLEVGYYPLTKSYGVTSSGSEPTLDVVFGEFEIVLSLEEGSKVMSLEGIFLEGVFMVVASGDISHVDCSKICVLAPEGSGEGVWVEDGPYTVMEIDFMAGLTIDVLDSSVIFGKNDAFMFYALHEAGVHSVQEAMIPVMTFSVYDGTPPKFDSICVTYDGILFLSAPSPPTTEDEMLWWRNFCGCEDPSTTTLLQVSLEHYVIGDGGHCEHCNHGDSDHAVMRFFTCDAMGIVNIMTEPDSGWQASFADQGHGEMGVNETVPIFANLSIVTDQMSRNNWFYTYECLWNGGEYSTSALDHETVDGPVRMLCPVPIELDAYEVDRVELRQSNRKGAGFVNFRLRNWDVENEFIDAAIGIQPPNVSGGLFSIAAGVSVGAVIFIGTLVFLIPCGSAPCNACRDKTVTWLYTRLFPEDSPEQAKKDKSEDASHSGKEDDLFDQIDPWERRRRSRGFPQDADADDADIKHDSCDDSPSNDSEKPKMEKEEGEGGEPAPKRELTEDEYLATSALGVYISLVLALFYILASVYVVENILVDYRISLLYSEEDLRTLREEEKRVELFVVETFSNDSSIQKFSATCFPQSLENAFYVDAAATEIDVTFPSLEQGGTRVILSSYESIVYRSAKKGLNLAFPPTMSTISHILLEFEYVQIEKVGQTLSDGMLSHLTSVFPVLTVAQVGTPPRLLLALYKALVLRRTPRSMFNQRKVSVYLRDSVRIRKYNRIPYFTLAISLITLLGSVLALRFPLLKFIRRLELVISKRFPHILEALLLVVLYISVGFQFYVNFALMDDLLGWHFPIFGSRIALLMVIGILLWQSGFCNSWKDIRCTKSWCRDCCCEPILTFCAYCRPKKAAMGLCFTPVVVISCIYAVFATISLVTLPVFFVMDFMNQTEEQRRLVDHFREHVVAQIIYVNFFFDTLLVFLLLVTMCMWKCCKMYEHAPKTLNHRIVPLSEDDENENEDGSEGQDGSDQDGGQDPKTVIVGREYYDIRSESDDTESDEMMVVVSEFEEVS